MELLTQYYGSLSGSTVAVIGSVFVLLALGYLGARLIVWTLAVAAIVIGFGTPVPILVVLGAVAVVFNIPLLRRLLITSWVMNAMKGMMPKISETERTALDAGVVWVEADLFSGRPRFKKMLAEPYPELTAEEKSFLDGPVQKLCDVLDDWDVWKHRELPQAAWDIMRQEKFFGMIIPKEYGGLGLSALLNSHVVMKLGAHCIPACITVMVPNSLGPAELLTHYGTEEQKKRLLPRLADGSEMPCFALTEPTAGSDAGAITSNGVLFKGDDGKLYIKLNWKKRYITLAAISTILGLAFKLKDPENLLGKGENLGITCALIPSNTAGVDIGRRHDPLGVPFYNCPTEGHDVVVPADESIIGGIEWAGKGWKMLMESLAAGRGISLPAQSTGGAMLTTRVASAHSKIRKQFGMSIGHFEGIEEALARIAGYTYLLDATRKFTLGAIDKGIKPPVITAMAKYNTTERMRDALNDGMDIIGGNGISMGPRNLLGHGYIAQPIGVTVEGANILTRTLMIFGQGALRAHPFAYKEVAAMDNKDLAGFDRAFWGHIGHVIRNTTRSVLLSLSRGWLSPAPVGGPVARYYRKMAWTSATFAIMSDIAMGALGGTLKARQMITGRYADVLSWMYLGFSVLRRYEAEGRRAEDLPFVHFSMQLAFARIQEAFDGIFQNIGVPGIGWLFSGPIRLWSRLNTLGNGPSDKIRHQIAQAVQNNAELRNRLTEGMYIPTDPEKALGRLEAAFAAISEAAAVEKKIRKAIKAKKLPKIKGPKIIPEALKAEVITAEEAELLKKAEALRLDAIQVDDFSQEEYLGVPATPPKTASQAAI